MYFSGFGGKRQGMFEGFAAFAQLTTGRREEHRRKIASFGTKSAAPGGTRGPLHFAEDVVVLLRVQHGEEEYGTGTDDCEAVRVLVWPNVRHVPGSENAG